MVSQAHLREVIQSENGISYIQNMGNNNVLIAYYTTIPGDLAFVKATYPEANYLFKKHFGKNIRRSDVWISGAEKN